MNSKLNLLLFSLLVLFLMTACEKDDYTPDSAVRSAFNAKYPKAKRVEWDWKLGYSVAEFRDNGKEKDAWFDTDGTWVLTETDITVSELPTAVKTSIAGSKYASWRIDDATYLERKDLGPAYLVEVERGETEMDLYYSVEGKLLKDVPDDGDGFQAVPTPVNQKIIDAVNSKYTDAYIVEVDVETNFIEVDLMKDNQHFQMVLDKAYNWVQTEFEVEWIKVPEAVKNSFEAEGYSFNLKEDDVERVIRPQDAVEIILYRFELDREPKDVVLYYSSEGVRLDS